QSFFGGGVFLPRHLWFLEQAEAGFMPAHGIDDHTGKVRMQKLDAVFDLSDLDPGTEGEGDVLVPLDVSLDSGVEAMRGVFTVAPACYGQAQADITRFTRHPDWYWLTKDTPLFILGLEAWDGGTGDGAQPGFLVHQYPKGKTRQRHNSRQASGHQEPG